MFTKKEEEFILDTFYLKCDELDEDDEKEIRKTISFLLFKVREAGAELFSKIKQTLW